MKEKRNKILILSIAIVAVIAIIAGSTYAYWQITKTQTTPNDIVAACLDLNLEDKSAAIDLDSAWPISDDEANSLTGYTFTVTNNCDEEINYIVGLNRVEESNYLQDSSIRLKLDEKSAFTYSELSDIDYADAENTYTSRVSKQVSVERVVANGSNEHTIRVWLSESAPVSEQSKIFQGQVFITGGQGIEVPALNECFAIDDSGTITGYNYECGTEVVVPAEINGVKVKTINSASFALSNMQLYVLYNETTEEEKYVYYYTDENTVDDFIAFVKQDMCENPTTCTLEDIEAMGLKIITTEEEFNAIDWQEYKASGYEISGPEVGIFNIEDGDFEEPVSQVTSLDLSDAVHLENIGDYAFYDSLLETLIWPENGMLITIGSNAFESTQIKTLNLCDSLNEVAENAFNGNDFNEVIIANNKLVDRKYWDGNKSIKKLIIKSNITEIPLSTFSECDIEEVAFEDTHENPSQLVSISGFAFADNNLTKIELPGSLTQLAPNAFDGNNITEVKIGNVVQMDKPELNYGKHFGDNPVKKVIISTNVTEIPQNAFKYDIYKLEEVVFEDTAENPSQLKTIGADAFWNNNISSLTLPKSLETIESDAFASNNITELNLPSQLKNIGTYAFGSNELEGVIVLPESITNLSFSIFGDNYDVTTIVIKRTKEDALANISFHSEWNFVGDIGSFDVGTPTTGFAEVIYDPNYTE